MVDLNTPPPGSDDSTPAASIRAAALHGVRWYAIVRVFSEATGLVSSVLLARLIAPAEFGAVAVAFGLVCLGGGVLGAGLTATLIQRREIGRSDLETTSFLAFAAAGLLAGLFVFVMPLISQPLFGERTTHLIQISALTLPFAALGVVPTAQLQRQLAFRRLGTFELISQVSAAVVAVVLAAAGRGGEAIIIGSIAASAVQALLVCRSAPLARPVFHRSSARKLLVFGAPAGLASIVYSSYQNIDYLIIGARLGTVELGYYWRAFQLGLEYQGKVSRVMLQLAFPIYSRLEDLEAMKRMRARIVRVHASILFPFLTLLAAIAPVLVPFVYGERWSGAVVPTQILAVAGFAAVVGTGGGPLMMAAGKPRWLLVINLTTMTVFSAVIYLTTPFGVVAVCVGVVAYQVVNLIATQLLLQKLLRVPVAALLVDTGPALVGSVALACVAFPLTELLSASGLPPAALLAIVPIAGLASYLTVMRYAFRPAWEDLMLLRRAVAPVQPALAAVQRLRRRDRAAETAREKQRT